MQKTAYDVRISDWSPDVCSSAPVRQPLGLPLYLVAGLGLASWGPLRQSDARDLAGGTRSEVAGPDRLAWSAAQLAVLGAVAVVGAAVFLGGWQGPDRKSTRLNSSP